MDAARTFTLGGGTLTFNTISLMPGATPAKIAVNGGVTVNALGGATAMIIKGAGSGSSGFIDLAAGDRTFTIGDSAAEVDLSMDIPISNGALTKSGSGAMRLTAANSFSAGTTISSGRLIINNTSGSGTGSGPVTVNGGILSGAGSIAGVVTLSNGGTLAPGTASSIGILTLNSPPIFAGTNWMRINRNGGSPLVDRVALTAGTLTYGGTLVVSNIGAPLVGGEVFTNFSAPQFAGTFDAFILPTLNSGLNWYTGKLPTNGTIAVNRSPIVNPITFTNNPPFVLEIPITNLLANLTDADGDPLQVASIDLTTTNGITLITNSAFIYYSNYVNIPDKFTYAISDSRGGIATGSVYITNSPAARFASAPVLNGNALTLHVVGRPGELYSLERSTNLPTWIAISTNALPSTGLLDFVDPNPPYPSAFYQLRWWP